MTTPAAAPAEAGEPASRPRSFRELATLAREQFPPSQFVRAEGVCVFVEHETLGADGQPLKFDAASLAAIVDSCNARIAESGSFTVLAAGHTPTPEERSCGAAQPDVVGFCGPFRLGQFGASKKSAIFADEWRRRDSVERLSRLPRRSVELWRATEPQSAFFDPIAALGAETPRLALGLNYSLDGSAAVLRYAAAAPQVAFEEAAPLASNLAPVAAPSDALREEVQAWLQRGDVQQSLERYFAERAGVVHVAQPVVDGPAAQQSADPAASNPSDAESHAELAKAHAALCFSMERLQRETADVRREARLERLAASQALDLEAEKGRCLFARGSKMTDEDFERHAETLARYAQSLPLGRSLPVGVEPDGDDSRPARPDTIAAAVDYADRMRRSGSPVRFRAPLAHVRGEG